MDFEFYETPETFTRYLFDTVPITGVIFEPCVGSGAIVKVGSDMRGAATGGDLWLQNDLDSRWNADFHLDATGSEAWRSATRLARSAFRKDGIDWTVSNPPFTPAISIIAAALEYSRVGVAMHLRASIHEPVKGGRRRKDGTRVDAEAVARWRQVFIEASPTGILWLPRFGYQRSKTTGLWTTDSVGACWVIWLKDPAAPQFIRYAPEWVIDALDAETPAYRTRMDALMAERKGAA